MSDNEMPLDRRLTREILFARERVYRFGQPTPLERLVLHDGRPAPEIWVKREDLSPIKAYKWRGACNRMALLTDEERARGVVAASAGNHAQGVALAAAKLGIQARIHMPRSTPRVKQDAVRQHGAGFVKILLSGDSYDDAYALAMDDAAKTGAVYVHAYDDVYVMAGQGTLADEVIMSGQGPFDASYLQIGGGGMAAATSLWLKTHWPEMDVVGVEQEGQASMKAALKAGAPHKLDQVDLFCDGTAVRKAGSLTYEVCRETLSRIETVTNADVSAAIRVLWEGLRCISEPSGALGLAAVLKHRAELAGKRVLVVVTGANIDFLQLGRIAQGQGAGGGLSRTLRIRIDERRGTMLELLDGCFAGLNISDYLYGKGGSVSWPVFTLTAQDESVLAALPERLNAAGIEWKDCDEALETDYRAIPLRGDLLQYPVFMRLDFYERPGALHDFLDQRIRARADLVYFNYRQSGERIGRALIGLDFESAEERDALMDSLPERGEGYRSCTRVDAATMARLVGQLPER